MIFCSVFLTLLVYVVLNVKTIALLETPSNNENYNVESEIFQILSAKEYIPNDDDLPKTTVIKREGDDATYILSKLTDEELIKLLSQVPKRNEYELNDLVQASSNTNENKIPYYDKAEKEESNKAFFKLDKKEVEPFNYNSEADPKYNALQKLNNLLYSRPQQQNSDEDPNKDELLFDVLIEQLKSLCCKKTKPRANTINKLRSLLKKVISNKKSKLEKSISPQSTVKPMEYIFLIINDEIKSQNESDDLITVDPESLSKNSSVLLLGPIATPLSQSQLKLVMTRIANELSKPEYLPLLKKISEGALDNSNVGFMKSLVTGPDSRRYIKPHRCNHQSKLARVYGGTKWLICTDKESVRRCGWLNQDPIYIEYHDEEWGKPEYDRIRLFEMICLEGQQAGLSWITILKKRNNYRKLFFDFDPYKIVQLTESDKQKLLNSSEIIRHKGKINAIISNAKSFIEMEEQGKDFSDFVWDFVENKPILNSWIKIEEIPTKTFISEKLSKALKSKGFKFVGPTICYSFMQACGLINDHVKDCICYVKYA